MNDTSFQTVLDALPLLAACVHRDGQVLHANAAMLAALEQVAPSIAGRPLAELVHPDDLAAVVAAAAAPPRQVRWCARGKGWAVLETSTVEITYEGRPALVSLGRDLEAHRAQEARLAVADRLAAVGMLAAGVAHEINNPLTYLMSNLDHVRDGLKQLSGPPELLSDLDAVTAEAKAGAVRIAQIVRSLKAISRIDEEKRSSVDVVGVLEGALKIAMTEIRHRARLVTDFKHIPPVYADDARLTQVFLNLLINAAQAVPEGYADKNEIRVSTRTTDDGLAVIEIRDTGLGISPEHIARVFDPFFTTKPQGVGTGLGLSICHGIVTALGGRISAESEVGKGSTFRVTFPPSMVAPSDHAPLRRISSGESRGGRILVVDDDVAIGSAIRRTLARKYDLVTTTSGREALDRIRGGERFDLILCDLMMPVLSGMDLYDELTRVAADQAESIVFITGGAFTPAARAFLERVPNCRLDKPFDADRLKALVRSVVEMR